jgi:hypothetical protein
MACVTDQQTLLEFCDLKVIQDQFGGPLVVAFTVQSQAPVAYSVVTGVVTIVNSQGQPIVVATFGHQNVSLSLFSGPVYMHLATHETIPDSWAGKTLHISVGPSQYFGFQVGQVFVPVPSAMLRTSVTLPRGVPKFSLSIESAPATVSPTSRPSVTVAVHNSGTGSGVDTLTAVTKDSSGRVVSTWTVTNSPIVPAGGTQPVTLYELAPPGNEYAGQTLQVIVSDTLGHTATTTFTVSTAGGGGTTGGGGGGGGSTGGGTGGGGGSSPPPPPSSQSATPVPAGIIVGGVLVLGGATLLLLAGRRR